MTTTWVVSWVEAKIHVFFSKENQEDSGKQMEKLVQIDLEWLSRLSWDTGKWLDWENQRYRKKKVHWIIKKSKRNTIWAWKFCLFHFEMWPNLKAPVLGSKSRYDFACVYIHKYHQTFQASSSLMITSSSWSSVNFLSPVLLCLTSAKLHPE
jgi:hypothetical protein